MRVDESIRVAAPRRRVWELVSLPERYSEFMVGSSWEPIRGEPTSGLRARFWLNVKVGSTDLGGVVELVELDPPHELAWTNVSGIDNRGPLDPARAGRRDRGDDAHQLPGARRRTGAGREPARGPDPAPYVRKSLGALKDLLEKGEG